ncbi:MAG: Mu transposase C-terminal domain-containing protein [Thermotaleaceae bacterium]
MDKYIRHVDKLRFIPCREELDHIFLYRTIRSVKNDATLSIDNNLFEVPLKYVGERIHVRYDPTAMEKAYIFSEEGQILDTIYPVQKIDNTKVRREQNIKGIDFSPFSTH